MRCSFTVRMCMRVCMKLKLSPMCCHCECSFTLSFNTEQFCSSPQKLALSPFATDSVCNILSPCLVPKHVKITSHKITNLPLVYVYWHETWYFTLRKEHFLRGFREWDAEGHISAQSKRKGKAVPLQAWSGPEGSRKLRFPDFMTTAQDGGKVVSLTHQPSLPPGNKPDTHFC